MKRQILSLTLLLFAIAAFSAQSETTISLNGVWNFKADYYDKGETEKWSSTFFNDSGWDKMNVPGNWDLRNEYANYSGKGWYRTTFITPDASNGKVVRLNFEAVGIDYKVWLNGEQLGNVQGGYFSMNFDISKKLKAGAVNKLVVCADNTFRSGAYWSWGGIRRPVSLIINEPLFIESTHITAIPNLKNGTANISINALIANSISNKGAVELSYEVSFGGKTIKTGKQTVLLTRKYSQNADFQINLARKEVKLWHFDFPNLYSIKLRLTENGQVTHEITDRFGIRKAEIVNGKFLLNGESVRAMGLNWVADDRMTGNTLPADVYKRDIDNMKSLGVNLARLSHVPLPKEIYDYLDEKGMMVIAEIPLWGMTYLANPDNRTPFSWLTQLVNTNFNHPSIIGWCVGNEIGYVNQNQRVMEYAQKSIQFVKDSLDASRIVVLVSHSANNQPNDPSKYGDFVPFNSYGWWGGDMDRIHANQPDKAIFLTEIGENLIGEDLNTSTGSFPKMLNQVRGREYVFGASLWTYNDYRSNHRSSNLTWDGKVSQNRDWGVIDGYGNKKRAYEILRKEHAPFKTLSVKQDSKSLSVSLLPRAVLDLPAYTLRGFKLTVEEFGNENQLLKKTELALPEVKPGDLTFTKLIPVSGEVAARRISVVSPTNYSQMDTTIYYRTPQTPEIKAVFNNGEKIRVVFNHVNFATEYKLMYGEKELAQVTKSTIDNYIETDRLSKESVLGKTFQLKLVAINSFGESSSTVKTELIQQHGKMPPVIKAVRPFQHGISIGYSNEKAEYLYKVQYSTTADFSSNTHVILTTTKGACFIPELTPGKKYYVRMSVVEQYDIESGWGEAYSIQL